MKTETMRPYISRRTGHFPLSWYITARGHYLSGPVPDGEIVRAADLSERGALAIRQGRACAWDPDTKRAAFRRLWQTSHSRPS